MIGGLPVRICIGALALVAVACDRAPRSDDEVGAKEFPVAHRTVAPIISSRYSTEEARDRLSEANVVMRVAGIERGMTVADIGAGEGYYTVRLATRVGEKGRVVAQDIVPAVIKNLGDRILREKLDNVSVKTGAPANPKLPARSFDRIFMVHMYHEIRRPYEFLWRMRPSLRPDGRVIVVEADRPIMRHGTPGTLLDCEFGAVGYDLVERKPMPAVDGYIAIYEARGERPDPTSIAPCPVER